MSVRKGLGKGLSALVEESSVNSVVEIHPDNIKVVEKNMGVLFVDATKVLPSRHQPRKEFDESHLEELAESIRQHGVIQPLIVSDLGNGTYELSAGERRLRASQLAGLNQVPVVIREFDEKDKLAIALIENIQRTDLNAIEIAEAYKEMMDRLNLTQDEVAQAVGKSRTSVTNVLRLLKLPENVRKMVVFGNISEGHARVLLSLSDPFLIEESARFVEEKDLSVRETEDYVRKMKINNSEKNIDALSKNLDVKHEKISALEEKFVKTLGLKTVISGNTEKGFIKLFYHTPEDLEIIVKTIVNNQ